MCYNKLKKRWLDWSNGYDVPLERTTLRGIKRHAAIAGKALAASEDSDGEPPEPVKLRDAIWPCFIAKRPRTGEVVFKSGQLDLAIEIYSEDFDHAVERRNDSSLFEHPKSPVQNVLTATDLDAASDKGVGSSHGTAATASSALGFKRTRPTTVSHPSP
jgi:hypothetical protein